VNEPNWYEIGLAALIAVMGWLFKRHVGRVDQIEENYVTREELNRAMTQAREERRELRDDRLRMHQENTSALQYIRERVDKLVDRK
jgi:hypothetical protein